MANTKISALTSGNPAQSSDLLPIDRSGANFSITAGSIAALGGSGTPAGMNTQVQYNNGGVFGASAGFTFNSTLQSFTVGQESSLPVSIQGQAGGTNVIAVPNVTSTAFQAAALGIETNGLSLTQQASALYGLSLAPVPWAVEGKAIISSGSTGTSGTAVVGQATTEDSTVSVFNLIGVLGQAFYFNVGATIMNAIGVQAVVGTAGDDHGGSGVTSARGLSVDYVHASSSTGTCYGVYIAGDLQGSPGTGYSLYIAAGGSLAGAIYSAQTTPSTFLGPLGATSLTSGTTKWSSGAGSPNSSIVGSPGDLYTNTSGGAGTTLYVKESGTATNTGWVGK